LEQIDFSSLKTPESSESYVKDEKTLIIKKWNWDYSEFLKFQTTYQEFVRKNTGARIYIFTNHPHCFTLGRGNERGEDSLLEFDNAIRENLGFPVYDIHRGGGITYHYPGQWIFYPIVRVTPSYSLNDHMCWLLKLVRNHLENEYQIKALATQKIMGVWYQKMKIASIGVGLNRFITEHGLAFNLNSDPIMSAELKKINPCGLNSNIYTFLNEVLDKPLIDLEEFHQSIIKSIP